LERTEKQNLFRYAHRKEKYSIIWLKEAKEGLLCLFVIHLEF
jgi:hypothetical protein